MNIHRSEANKSKRWKMGVKNNIHTKLRLFLIVFFIVNVITLKGVKAEEKNIIIELIKGQNASSAVFTRNDGLWYPGRSEEKSISIKNTNNVDCYINSIGVTSDIKTNFGEELIKGTEKYESFLRDMKCKVVSGKKVVYEGDFKKLINEGIKLDKNFQISSKDKKNYTVNVWMEMGSGNETQGINAAIDIKMNYAFVEESSAGAGLVKTGSFLDQKVLISVGAVLIILGAVWIVKNKRVNN